MEKTHAGLTISDTPFKSGMITGRRWDAVVQAMIAAKELYLHPGEVVTGVSFDIEYGLYFKTEFTP